MSESVKEGEFFSSKQVIEFVAGDRPLDRMFKETVGGGVAGPFNTDRSIDVGRIRKVIAKIQVKFKEELQGKKLGYALVFDGWATELMIAIGDYPKPGQCARSKEVASE